MKSPSSTEVLRFGAPLQDARCALVLLHGRGSSSAEIASLAEALPADGVAWVAPSAVGGSWYPHRFLAPLEQNEPWLSRALGAVADAVQEAHAAGLAFEQIGVLGFSQGACLALEFAARNPRRYRFIAGLSGALIGPLQLQRPATDLRATPVLVSCAESDAHIPLEHVERAAQHFAASGAAVTKQIHRGSAHALYPVQVDWLNDQLKTT